MEKDIGLGGIAKTKHRSIHNKTITALVASFKQIGQLQPIVVTPKKGTGYELIAGYHRLEAARRCKWPSIRATILTGISVDTAKLATIDENLIRSDLTAAERASWTKQRKELYLKLHPETGVGKAPGKKGGGKAKSKNAKLASFVKATTKATGQSERAVARDARRGAKLDAKTLEKVQGTSLDKGTELDALIKLPKAKREKIVKAAEAGEKVSAVKEVSAEESANERKEAYADPEAAIEKASTKALAEFTFAANNYLPKMTADDQKKAIALVNKITRAI